MKKVQTWEKVASEFNSRSEVLRTTKQLQTAYLNLKRVTRKNVTAKNVRNIASNTYYVYILSLTPSLFKILFNILFYCALHVPGEDCLLLDRLFHILTFSKFCFRWKII